MNIEFDKGSYRDPAGKVFYYKGRVFRGLTTKGAERFKYIKENHILDESIKKSFLIPTKEITDLAKIDELSEFDIILEHEKIDYITYPYEWCFDQLKDAALHHLDFQLFLLEKNCVLIDASAYNIQFINSKPIFIDVLSLSEYKDGSYWVGHKQFCENYLNPLILSSKKDIDFNNWFRGNLEGIPTSDLNKILTLKDKFNFSLFFHVYLMARYEKKILVDPKKISKKINKKKTLSKKSYKSMLIQLKNFILELKKNKTLSKWDNYSKNNSYSAEEENKKIEIIENFAKKNKFNFLADLGCNDGLYSFKSLNCGVKKVFGFDFDLNVLNRSYLKSKKNNLNFQPIYMNINNPSPNQGWNEKERKGFNQRMKFDGMIALALYHHITIGNNISMDEAVEWLVSFAPKGIIEFVPKNDEMIVEMMKLKGDIFDNYSEERFKLLLEQKSTIVSRNKVNASGRVLYEYRTN